MKKIAVIIVLTMLLCGCEIKPFDVGTWCQVYTAGFMAAQGDVEQARMISDELIDIFPSHGRVEDVVDYLNNGHRVSTDPGIDGLLRNDGSICAILIDYSKLNHFLIVEKIFMDDEMVCLVVRETAFGSYYRHAVIAEQFEGAWYIASGNYEGSKILQSKRYLNVLQSDAPYQQ